VVSRSRAASSPQEAQIWLGPVGRDDEEATVRRDLDEDLCASSVERFAADDALCFSRLAVPLVLDDLPREDDVFEVVGREVVIY
jgi:hypothetical protein